MRLSFLQSRDLHSDEQHTHRTILQFMARVALLTRWPSSSKILKSVTTPLRRQLTGRFSCGKRARGCSQLLRPIAWTCGMSSGWFRRKPILHSCTFPLRSGLCQTDCLPTMSSGCRNYVTACISALKPVLCKTQVDILVDWQCSQ